MKTLPGIIAIGCLLATSRAQADEQPAVDAKGSGEKAPNAALLLLQGKWEGIALNTKTPEQKQIGADIYFLKPGVAESTADPQEKVTITITGNSFHLHRDKDFWFKTTLSLPEGKVPWQFHATINDSRTTSSIGEVVGAIFKIEERPSCDSSGFWAVSTPRRALILLNRGHPLTQDTRHR